MAAVHAILPSAQAAWPLTSGSSSESAADSAGTAAGSRELPSATATLRKKPRRFVRLIGERRENSTQSAVDIPIQSINDGVANSGRPASAGSRSSAANDTFHGHTSWDVCRHTHFQIPLKSGRLTTRNSKG